jgi:hypothetical protein
MTICRNLGYIDRGIEIVPVKTFAEEMSTGVSYFEQFVWDLEKRGVADIDVPVLILGIAADEKDDAQTLKEIQECIEAGDVSRVEELQRLAKRLKRSPES